MKATSGFTLIELLAVIAIMLVLMVATFGTFSIFAERAGPEAVLSTIQSYLNTARDYAATNGVTTRINFTASANPGTDGTTIAIQYLPAGSSTWEDVPGTKPMPLQMYVLKDISSNIFKSLQMPMQTTSASYNPTTRDITDWQKYQKDLQENIRDYGFTLPPNVQVKTEHQNFFIEIDPSGYLRLNPMNPAGMVQNGLIVVKLSGGNVTGYAFYPLNASTGTRLIFE